MQLQPSSPLMVVHCNLFAAPGLLFVCLGLAQVMSWSYGERMSSSQGIMGFSFDNS
jgi:hypothetical protein